MWYTKQILSVANPEVASLLLTGKSQFDSGFGRELLGKLLGKAVPLQRKNQIKPDTEFASSPVSEWSKGGHVIPCQPMGSEVKFSGGFWEGFSSIH